MLINNTSAATRYLATVKEDFEVVTNFETHCLLKDARGIVKEQQKDSQLYPVLFLQDKKVIRTTMSEDELEDYLILQAQQTG